ncbi:helix-turn-helix domain-containing protein [Corynebacterium nasicanis]|uniref:Helix-turn-helix domain-containing protein n=1 Tax=Corynebacterium nasicanis TaxID=1448267 RepID=A0ABW1QCT3_9CORY
MPIDEHLLGAANADSQLDLVLKLREIRKANGVTVAEVAAAMDVDAAMIYRFEKGGTNFTAATLRKYAKAAGALLRLDAVNATSMSDLSTDHTSHRATI